MNNKLISTNLWLTCFRESQNTLKVYILLKKKQTFLVVYLARI